MKPLFIVTTGGGLGNQIISYALWLYLKKLGYHTHLYLRKNSLANTFEIENDFSRKTYAMNFLLYVVKKIERLKRFVKETDKQYSSFGGLNVIDYPEWPDYKFIGEILPELKQKLVFIKESFRYIGSFYKTVNFTGQVIFSGSLLPSMITERL